MPYSELRGLFHRLNNQLSVILAHAELLEIKGLDDPEKNRASQIVSSALGALDTVKSIRESVEREKV